MLDKLLKLLLVCGVFKVMSVFCFVEAKNKGVIPGSINKAQFYFYAVSRVAQAFLYPS